jgi:SPP1 gp7 family putative phage head morphogenesis protein
MGKSPNLSRVKRLLEQINIEVAQLPEAALRDLIPALGQVRRELEGALSQFLAEAGADAKFTTFQLRRALYQVRGALNAVDRTKPHMVGAMRAAGVRGGQMAVKHLGMELAAQGAHFAAGLNPIALPVAARLAQVNKLHLDQFKASAERWAKTARDTIRRELAVGVLRGESVGEMANRLAKVGVRNPRFEAAPESKAGAAAAELERQMMYPAQRIVRTEVVAAYNDHARAQLIDLAAEHEDVRQVWIAAIDSRVCPDCAELDGAVCDAGGEFPGAGDKGPPLHPNCRCATGAWFPEPKGSIKLGGLPGEGGDEE